MSISMKAEPIAQIWNYKKTCLLATYVLSFWKRLIETH